MKFAHLLIGVTTLLVSCAIRQSHTVEIGAKTIHTLTEGNTSSGSEKSRLTNETIADPGTDEVNLTSASTAQVLDLPEANESSMLEDASVASTEQNATESKASMTGLTLIRNSTTMCPTVQIKLESGSSMWSLRKSVEKDCENQEEGYGAFYRLSSEWEGNLLIQECIKGGQIGQSICAQEGNDPEEDPKVAPLGIVNNLEPINGLGIEAWENMKKEWCAKEPQPVWTGFRDCYHACQYFYVDCEQWPCKICNPNNTNAALCHGVRDSSMKWDDEPQPKFRFLDACIYGCRKYVQKKIQKRDSEKGGPACQVLRPIQMARRPLRRRFEHNCKASAGILHGRLCHCLRVIEGSEESLECVGERKDPGKEQIIPRRSSPGEPKPGCFEDIGHPQYGPHTGFRDRCQECFCDVERKGAPVHPRHETDEEEE